MNELPAWRMVGLSVACATAACGAGFAACAMTQGNGVASFAATSAVLSACGFLTLRWWLRACRQAGIETAAPGPTWPRALYVAAILAMIVFGVAANFFAYARFGDRLLQLTVALAIGLPTGFASAWIAPRLQRSTVRANDAPLLRFSLVTTLVAIPLMLGNVVLQIHSHDYPDLVALKNTTIALMLSTVPLMPMQAYVTWRRYVRARDAVGATLARG